LRLAEGPVSLGGIIGTPSPSPSPSGTETVGPQPADVAQSEAATSAMTVERGAIESS
jgi:hypothetical protein